MSRMFRRRTLEEVADAVSATGLKAVQLNLLSAGLASLPGELNIEVAHRIGAVFASRGLLVAAVSGSFNTIHPDPEVRVDGIRKVGLLASRCDALRTKIITLCTGTRDPDNMWRYHPANGEPRAWQDLVRTIRKLLKFAQRHDITLAFEPEVANVVDNAAKAQQLIEETGSPRLRVLLDPANLVRPSDLPDTRRVLECAFARVGPYIALAHAKDVAPPESGQTECRRVSVGNGLMDYKLYLELLRSAGFRGALIMHDLEEQEVPACKARLESLLSSEPP